MIRPVQRVGHIGNADNRFCGAAVFGELARQLVDTGELTARACGAGALSAIDRDVVRLIALALTSPDARVWPLKLARTLASYGNPQAGMYGAQLLNRNDTMGPGAIGSCARSLRWLRARVGDDARDEALAAAVGEHLAERGRIAGFGVPLRPRDERLLALHEALRDHPAIERPTWGFHLRVIAAVQARSAVEPNVVMPVAALALDAGIPAERCGIFGGLLMAHLFAAHAAEAAEHDGPWLQAMPASSLDDRSPPLRRSPAAAAAAAASRGPGSMGPRRSLPW